MSKPNYDVFAELLRRNFVKAADVCKATGIDSSTITNWKKGRYAPKNDKVELIAEYFGVPVWAFWGDVDSIDDYMMPDFLVRTGDNTDPILIEQHRTYDVAAGQGRINEEYEEPNADGEYSTVRICGDSMLPTLRDGDIVRVHHITDDIKPSDFAIVKINGNESTCKHIEVTTEGIWLRAENKDVFEDKFYSIHEVLTLPVSIIGIAEEIVSRRLK